MNSASIESMILTLIALSLNLGLHFSSIPLPLNLHVFNSASTESMIFHSFIHSIIHSGYFYSASSSPLGLLLRGAPNTARRILCQSASEGVAQGPYVATRAEFETTTLRTIGDDFTNEPPFPTWQQSRFH